MQARLIGEYDNLGRARIEHVWLDDRPVAAITYTYSGTSTTPNSTDDQLRGDRSSGHAAADHECLAAEEMELGQCPVWRHACPNENPEGLGAYVYNLRFPGQYFDKETNHHYNHHRDYESTSGQICAE